MQRWLCGTGIFNPPARYSSPRATGIHKLDSRGRVSANPRDDEKEAEKRARARFILLLWCCPGCRGCALTGGICLIARARSDKCTSCPVLYVFFSPEQLHEVADELYQRCRERFGDDGITG